MLRWFLLLILVYNVNEESFFIHEVFIVGYFIGIKNNKISDLF